MVMGFHRVIGKATTGPIAGPRKALGGFPTSRGVRYPEPMIYLNQIDISAPRSSAIPMLIGHHLDCSTFRMVATVIDNPLRSAVPTTADVVSIPAKQVHCINTRPSCARCRCDN